MIDSDKTRKYAELASGLYERMNRRSRGWLAVLVRVGRGVWRGRATLAAAAITYFSIFSIFPLLMIMLTTLGAVLDKSLVHQLLQRWLGGSFPVSLEALLSKVEATSRTRDPFGVIALLGFIWAASGMFNAMLVSINGAWNVDTVRSKLQSRLLSLVLVTALAIVIVLLMVVLQVGKLIIGLLLPFGESLIYRAIPLTVSTLILWAIYQLGVATRVDSRAALIGAALGSVAIELTTGVFSWFLSTDWSIYQLLYGSLGAAIGLLLWAYVCNLIILIGAYLAEAIQARWESAVPAEFYEPLALPS